MLRGQSRSVQATAQTFGNPASLRGNPQTGRVASSGKNPSNTFAGPPTISVQGNQLRGQDNLPNSATRMR